MIFDFDIYYYAALALLHGQNPYLNSHFLNPIWTLIPILPLTLLPLVYARFIWTIVTVLGFYFAFVRFGFTPRKAAILLIIFPFMWTNVIFGNVDWIVLLAATLPIEIGIWGLILKPQISIILILAHAFSPKRIREIVFILFCMVCLVGSFFIWGVPRAQIMGSMASLFPIGVIISILILRKRKDKIAQLASGPLISPFVNLTSWIAIAPLIGTLTNKKILLFTVISWLGVFTWAIRSFST